MKWGAFFLTAALATASVACSGDDDSVAETTPPATAAVTQPATPPPTTTPPAATTQPVTQPSTTLPETTLPATTQPPTIAPPDTGINPDGVDALPPLDDAVALPIVFVHGFAGSAQQIESNAMRFEMNGYPVDRIVAYEQDGAGLDPLVFVPGLADTVDATLAEYGVDQVYLIGHSRGTSVSNAYLDDADHAAKVAKYVAIDGRPCPELAHTPPCYAPTQAVFAGQAHVEVASSPEAFAAQFEFLFDVPPAVVDVVAQREPVVIEGRAVDFPANTGRAGTTLDIWQIDPATGQRLADTPHATFALADDGAFGPVELAHGAHYEYALTSPESATVHHIYVQPYLRSSRFVRLLSGGPESVTRVNTNASDDHVSLIAMRMREWYAEDRADVDGDQRDVLELSSVDGTVDALAKFVGNGTIGVHLHDDAATPGESTLTPLPFFSEQPFQSGVDVLLPASPDASGTITVTNYPRGDRSAPQTFNVPDWPSSGHAVSLLFTDFPL
ncbi:MAG TPA: hypothetical protein VNQ73_08920 [Ilumatobacter sp.]|nr:hypothetical protein [Ilumatobacter sp.]